MAGSARYGNKYGTKYRWPNGVVPYKFSDEYEHDPKHKKIVEEAILHMNKKLLGCIKIRLGTLLKESQKMAML